MLARRALLGGTAAGVLLSAASGVRALLTGGSDNQKQAILLTTLTFVNTSASTQAANSPTQMFGLPFRKGDIPSGQYPQMQVASDGTAVPLSLGCYVYWSDGSVRFCAALARCPKSISGKGSLKVNVLNGGNAPTASGRTLTEVYNASIQVNVVGAGSNFGLSGTWNAELANDANNYQQAAYVDGSAGKVWRIRTHFVQAGSAHGQLECDHYVQALNDSNGSLGAFRYLPRICQPWYNVDRPSKNWRAFAAAPTFQYGAGSTKVNFPWPYAALTFTWSRGASFSATGISRYYRGQGESSGNKYAVIPCYLTTTGTLPAGLSSTQLYFARIANAADTFALFTASNTGTSIPATNSGSGRHTINFAPTCLHFGSVFGATTAAKFNFLQGVGSISTESTIQVQFSQRYLHSTKLVPPYDLSLSPSDNTWNYNWDPIIPGTLDQQVNEAGERDDIGPLTAWHARAFYSQSTLSETLVRTLGLASAHFSYLLRDGNGGGSRGVTTYSSANVGNPATNYTGLPASLQSKFEWQGAELQGGFTAPPANNYSMGFSTNETSHIPSCAYYAYLVTGEPQYLDLLMDEANGAVFTQFADAHRNPTNPSTRYGVTDGYNNEIRACAWGTRNLAQAAALAPSIMPDGTGLSAYIADLLSATCKRANDVMTNTLMGSYAATSGLWTVVFSSTNYAPQQSWQTGYFVSAMCFAAGAADNIDALTWLNTHATWLLHCLSTFGGYTLYDFQEHNGPGITYGGRASAAITADVQWAVQCPCSRFSWTNANPGIFTIIPAAGTGWTLTNGDKFIFGVDGVGSSWPHGLAADTPYYAINVSGNTCNLSALPGGMGLATNRDGSLSLGGIAGPYFIPAVPPASNVTGLVSPSGAGGADGYLANVRAGTMWMAALGVSGLSRVISDANGRIAANSISFVRNPKYAMQPAF